MMADGFLEEVRNLKSEGISPNILGYRELNAHLEGKMSLLEATDLIKQKTRHLAKRQETWFRHQMKANLLIVDDKTETLKEMERLIFEFLEAKKMNIYLIGMPGSVNLRFREVIVRKT